MRSPWNPWRISGPAAASLLVNALLIAALFNLGLSHVGSKVEPPALTVMTLAVLKGVDHGEEKAEAAEPSVLQAAATSSSAAEPTPVALTPPAVQSAPPLMAVPPAPLPVADAAVAISTPSPASHQATKSIAQPAAASAAPPARRGATDGLNVTAPSGTSRSYAAKIRSWLYAHKIYPRRARMRHEEGNVRVRFVIDRAGMLIEGVVLQGSGNSTLDEEAAAMMQRASPFPKAPTDVPGERIEFVAPIEFTLPV